MRHQPRYRMNDSQILSTFQDLPPQPAPGRGEDALVFDACHVGVILRAVLFVVAVVAVGRHVRHRQPARLAGPNLDRDRVGRCRPRWPG
jgi:hypothetical protein